MFNNLFQGFHRDPAIKKEIDPKDDPRATKLQSLGFQTVSEAKNRVHEITAEISSMTSRLFIEKTGLAPYEQEIYDKREKERAELEEAIEAEESVMESAA